MAKNGNNAGSLKKLVFNDKYLIIFSLLLAILVWIVTSLNIGTDEAKTIKLNVPISLGDEVSEQLGMQYYSFQETIDINVTISGAKYVIGQVDANDFSVKFDTSAVNRTGEQTIPILVTNNSNTLDFTVTSTYPSSIDAYFDVNESKTFDLYLSYDESNTANGYTFGTPVLSEDKVIVSGPKTFVDKIDRTVLNVDFGESKDLTEPYNSDCNIEIEGAGVETNYLSITSRTDTKTPINQISVTLPVLKKAILPIAVDFEDKPSGLPDNALSIKYSRDSISAGVLDSADISNAVIGSIAFSSLNVGKNEFKFDVTNLKGITVLDEELNTIKATVNVNSSYEAKTIRINRSEIDIEGVEKGKKASIKGLSKNYVTVIAPSSTSASDLNLDIKCDVSEKREDKTYPLTITITNDNNAWVYSTYTATVDITA